MFNVFMFFMMWTPGRVAIAMATGNGDPDKTK